MWREKRSKNLCRVAAGTQRGKGVSMKSVPLLRLADLPISLHQDALHLRAKSPEKSPHRKDSLNPGQAPV